MTETNKKHDIELTDAAWARLQQQLSGEQQSPQWSRWSAQLTAASVMEQASGGLAAEPAGPSAAADNPPVRLSAEPDNAAGGERQRGAFNQWLRKRTKWIAAAAAVCVVAITIATPAGNQALASFLSKFRMQQLTVVQENDLKAILNGLGDGLEQESINAFGTFTQQSGKTEGQTDLAGAAKALGHKIVVPKDYVETEKIYVSPSNNLTFKMNVNEVNKAMKRLGAKKLLPSSVDGKPITLEMGASTHLYIRTNADGKGENEQGYSLSQMPVPVISVDPSLPAAEALDAIIQFPMLPDGIKQNLQTASVLQGGSVPLPIVENGQVDKVKIDGIEVIVSAANYGDGKIARHTATWVKDGQLFRLSGDRALTDRQAVLNKVSELIKS